MRPPPPLRRTWPLDLWADLGDAEAAVDRWRTALGHRYPGGTINVWRDDDARTVTAEFHPDTTRRTR
jgi:hypothetical protein